MRLFIGLPVSDHIRRTHCDLKERFSDIEGIKWVKPENLHVTLLFLGDVNQGINTARLGLIEFSHLILRATQIRLFPERKPRLIWADLENSAKLGELYRKVSSLFGMYGDFKAHITFARIKWISNENLLIVKAGIEHSNPLGIDFTAERFNLYSSELRPDGPVYRVIESFEGYSV